MLLHSLNVKETDPAKVIFMQLDVSKPGAPTLFNAELPNTDNGPTETTILDIYNFVIDVVENKQDGFGMDDYKKELVNAKKTEL